MVEFGFQPRSQKQESGGGGYLERHQEHRSKYLGLAASDKEWIIGHRCSHDVGDARRYEPCEDDRGESVASLSQYKNTKNREN